MSDPLDLAIREIQRLHALVEALLLGDERKRATIERLEIEKHDLAERLAEAEWFAVQDGAS